MLSSVTSTSTHTLRNMNYSTHNFTDKKKKQEASRFNSYSLRNDRREKVEKSSLLPWCAEVKTHTDFMHFTCFCDQNPFSFISLKLSSLRPRF